MKLISIFIPSALSQAVFLIALHFGPICPILIAGKTDTHFALLDIENANKIKGLSKLLDRSFILWFHAGLGIDGLHQI